MRDKLFEYMDWPRIEGIIYGDETAPKDLMGPRVTKDGVLIQGYFPEASAVEVKTPKKSYEMKCQDPAGYYAVLIPGKKVPSYIFVVHQGEETKEYEDPYVFPNQISEKDERTFLGGVSYDAYEMLGAHLVKVDDTKGTFFAVWAPNAKSVSLVGDFNHWKEYVLPMQRLPMSGIFELFVPGIGAGEKYKYAIHQKDGKLCLKADPYGQAVEPAPADASVVPETVEYEWEDDAWIQERWKYEGRKQPISIYETSLLDWKDLDALLSYLKKNGFTHVEMHPVMEYLEEETDGYSTSSYFAVTNRFGSAEKLKAWIDRLHQEQIGVFLDWTPAQFPKYEAGLRKFDGTALYENPEERMAVHPMWDTMLYNYASPMVADFLISNACFWLEEFHADGLRLDDVDAMLYLDYGRNPSEYTANIYGSNENLYAIEFLKHLNSIVHKRYPGILILAQEDGLWPDLTDSVENDHLGFDYKWSSGWTGDLLQYLSGTPEYRRSAHDQLTASMLYAYCEHYILTLGSRDVGSLAAFRDRIWGKTKDQKKSQIRAAYAYQFLHPGCKMMAPDTVLTEELSLFLKDLNDLYRKHPALYEKDDTYDGFEWIQLMKSDWNILTFLRKTEEEQLLVICNFSAEEQKEYMVGVPFAGSYKEIFNTDQKKYGGSGSVNPRAKASKEVSCDERENSIKVKVPAFGVAVFACTPKKEKKR